MPSKLLQPHALNDVVDDANLLMLLLLALVAIMSASISCVVCAFLRNRRRRDREDSILRQFYNAEYDHVDTLDCTRLPSQGCTHTWEKSSPKVSPSLPPGQAKTTDVNKHCVEKIDAPERSDYHVTNEYTSRSGDEGLCLKSPQKNLKSDMKLHEVDLDMINRPPMPGPNPYTSAKQPPVYSTVLKVKSDQCPPKCFNENGKSHMIAPYVNQTSVQTDESKMETLSTDLYSKLHDRNRRLVDNYSDVRLCDEQSDLRLSPDKSVSFPDKTNFHIYNNKEEFSHFDVCNPSDGLSQELRTTGSSDFNKSLAKDVNSIDKKAIEDDDDDASSTSDDLYVNSDPWLTRACKTVTTEQARVGDSDDISSDDEAVVEREELKTSSISNAIDTNSDSWKNSVYVNQQINAVSKGAHRYVSYNKDAALIGGGIKMTKSKDEDGDKSSVDDNIYLNWESRSENTHMNNMTMKGYYKQHSSDISPHQSINHDMGSANMSDTSSSSEDVYFYSDMSTLAVMRDESIQLTQGVDERYTNTDVKCSDIEEEDNSIESDNIYINSDMFSVVENESDKRIKGATSNQSILSDSDNDESDGYINWSISSNGAVKETEHEGGYVGRAQNSSQCVNKEEEIPNQSDQDLTSDSHVEAADDDGYYFQIY